MASRNVQDTDGRVWACRADDLAHGKAVQGNDVSILCTTATVTVPVRLTVGWQWMTISENGLARMISSASPVPRQNRA
jgi:hypothetical protein